MYIYICLHVYTCIYMLFTLSGTYVYAKITAAICFEN